MAAHKKLPDPLPPALEAIFSSKLSHPAVVVKLVLEHEIRLSVKTVHDFRARRYPGRKWPKNAEPGCRAKDVSPRAKEILGAQPRRYTPRLRSPAAEELVSLCAEVRRHNLRAMTLVNESRRLRDVPAINLYEPGDLW